MRKYQTGIEPLFSYFSESDGPDGTIKGNIKDILREELKF